MARIVYGVAGQGFGHSSRSHLIAAHLLERGHEILFAASMKSHSYLGRYFGERVKEVMGLRLIYSQGKLATLGTVCANLKNAPKGFAANRKLFREQVEPFRPDVVISDYEPFTAWWAWRHGVPYMTIDHQNTMTQCVLDAIQGTGVSSLTAKWITRAYYPDSGYHIVVNFFKAGLRSDKAFLAPPVLRREVMSRQAGPGEHIIFYTTDVSFREKMVELFGQFERQVFYIYGFDEDSRAGNCIFKKTSTEDFLDDLSTCRGVIATAGFSLICECLHFRKKMLLLPIRGQYEQVMNAYYMQKLGMGIDCRGLDGEAVERFLSLIEEPAAGAELILWPDNDRFYAILDETLEKIMGR